MGNIYLYIGQDITIKSSFLWCLLNYFSGIPNYFSGIPDYSFRNNPPRKIENNKLSDKRITKCTGIEEHPSEMFDVE